MTIPQLPALFLSPPESCSYLPRRQANHVFADPRIDLDDATYARLVELGFRRSGRLVYRPHCNGCQACLAVRVDVNRFRQRRAQRRAPGEPGQRRPPATRIGSDTFSPGSHCE